MADEPTLEGGCQCGKVRYRVIPRDVNAGTICHCRMCQRSIGAPFLAAFAADVDKVQWLNGEPAAYASSSISERRFCADCGTSLSYHVVGSDRISLMIATLDDPGVIRPSRVTGIESRLSWLDDLAHLPTTTSRESMGPILDDMTNNQHDPDRDGLG